MSTNLIAVANASLGGNIVTILVRQLIKMKGRQGLAAFRSKVAGLQLESADMEYVSPSVDVGCIPVTVKKQEAHSYRADVTQHSMESGAVLSDHVILQPIHIDVSFEITNLDLAKPQEAHDKFVLLMQQRTPLDLQTKHGIIENVILSTYQANNEAPNWGALDCRASFTQIKYISIKSIKFPENQVAPTDNTGGPDISKSAATEKSGGNVGPRNLTVEEQAKLDAMRARGL